MYNVTEASALRTSDLACWRMAWLLMVSGAPQATRIAGRAGAESCLVKEFWHNVSSCGSNKVVRYQKEKDQLVLDD